MDNKHCFELIHKALSRVNEQDWVSRIKKKTGAKNPQDGKKDRTQLRRKFKHEGEKIPDQGQEKKCRPREKRNLSAQSPIATTTRNTSTWVQWGELEKKSKRNAKPKTPGLFGL